MAIENRGPELQAVCYTLLTTALIAVCLRVYVRTCIVKNFGIDDYLMLVAFTFFTLFASFALVGVHYGTGRHRADLDDADFEKAMMYWWYCYLWYCVSMIASKISIGYFLLRITIRRIDVFLVYGTMLITVLTGVIFFFVTLLQCRPISFFWNRNQEGFCINVDVIIALTYLYSVFSVISDFTCAILPMFLIWKLNMDRKSKIALIPIMLMACVFVYFLPCCLWFPSNRMNSASSAVVVRFPFVKDFKNPDFLCSLPRYLPYENHESNLYTGATIDIALWSTTEQGLAVTAGSLATLRPLLRIITAKISTSSNLSGLHSTDHLKGSGFQSGGNSRGPSRGPFSLTTFLRGDDNGIQIADEESDTGNLRNDINDKSWSGNIVSEWQSRNESQAELTRADGKGQAIKITTTIKQQEERRT